MSAAGVIATHNQEAYAEVAIRSLRAEVDELVVVDDASTDSTWEVVDGLARELGFTAMRNPRREGVSSSYNRAVALVTEPVLVIQGGDDRTLPGRGRASLTALADPSVVLAFSPPDVIDAAGLRLPAESAGEFFLGEPGDDALARLFDVGNFVCAPSVAVRTADYRAAGGFPAGIDLLQDFALWLDLAARGTFHRFDRPVVEYRKHASNVSREYVGIDSIRLRRHAAENAWILNRFLDRADAQVIARIRPEIPRDGRTLGEIRMLVRLVDPRPALVRAGLAQLFDAIAEGGVSALTALGLDLDDLARFASSADHDNLGALERAASAAIRSSAPPSRESGI